MKTQPENLKTFKDANKGITWAVRLVRAGAPYGRDLKMTNGDDTLVEFYDTRYMIGSAAGQFVSRYYLSTLLTRSNPGLNLQGDIADWTICATTMYEIVDWLKAATLQQ